jgi:transcriptional regulator with XRE-family HTH domain
VTPESATVEVRLAGALLRHHREAARWSLKEAVAHLECDTSKISRIETGHRRPLPGEMHKLLAAYGVSPREQQAIAALTQSARAGWWGEYRSLLPDGMVDHALLESVADDVLVYDPQALPAFLQTSRYAAAVATADPALQTDEERRLAVLLSARRAADLRDRPGAFTVVLGEAALMQQVGGSEAMLAQLRQIAGGSEQSPVPAALQVVPFAAGAHPGTGTGPLTIMRFHGVTGIGAISRGWSNDGVSVARQRELTAAVRRFEALRDTALSPDKSRQLIRTVIRNWR